MQEMSVEEFKAKGLKIPKPKTPDPEWDRFVSMVGMFCISKNYDLPTKEYRFMHPERQFRFDLCWPRYDVAFEREGGTYIQGRHVRAAGYREDCIKYSHAAIRGWIVVRATTDMLKDGTALDLLAQALALASARGGSQWEAPQVSAAPHSKTRRSKSGSGTGTTPRTLPVSRRGRSR